MGISISEKVQEPVSQSENAIKLQREVLLAIESARTRFAIAMAIESKTTPLSLWNLYRDTEDRMRRLAKKLRKNEVDERQNVREWARALEVLMRLPKQGEALSFHQMLNEVAEELEKNASDYPARSAAATQPRKDSYK